MTPTDEQLAQWQRLADAAMCKPDNGDLFCRHCSADKTKPKHGPYCWYEQQCAAVDAGRAASKQLLAALRAERERADAAERLCCLMREMVPHELGDDERETIPIEWQDAIEAMKERQR